jgi:hypothetical protein
MLIKTKIDLPIERTRDQRVYACAKSFKIFCEYYFLTPTKRPTTETHPVAQPRVQPPPRACKSDRLPASLFAPAPLCKSVAHDFSRRPCPFCKSDAPHGTLPSICIRASALRRVSQPNSQRASHHAALRSSRLSAAPLSEQRFKVGQSVSYSSGPRGQAGSSGIYRITQLGLSRRANARRVDASWR